jgi:hypothetical protein
MAGETANSGQSGQKKFEGESNFSVEWSRSYIQNRGETLLPEAPEAPTSFHLRSYWPDKYMTLDSLPLS